MSKRNQLGRVESHGAFDGRLAASLGKAYDAVRYFNLRLASHEVTEDERLAYAMAFRAAYEAEAVAKRDHELFGWSVRK